MENALKEMQENILRLVNAKPVVKFATNSVNQSTQSRLIKALLA